MAENTEKAERLDIVDMETGIDDDVGGSEANLFRHVIEAKENDKSAVDKADEKEVKEQILPDDWDMEDKEDKKDEINNIREEADEKDRKNPTTKTDNSEDLSNQEESEITKEKLDKTSDYIPTYDVSRGALNFSHRMDDTEVERSDAAGGECVAVLPQLSHQLCEQLRLVLEPTKAAKFQGDFRTGKRLNMRKIIPYIASHFKKDKIRLRRVRPNKREFQVLVALDDSAACLTTKVGSWPSSPSPHCLVPWRCWRWVSWGCSGLERRQRWCTDSRTAPPGAMGWETQFSSSSLSNRRVPANGPE